MSSTLTHTGKYSVPDISIDSLRVFVQARREPCVIRGACNRLEIVEGCSSSRETTVEDRIRHGYDDSKEGSASGIEWLAQQIGSAKFRVFVSRPAAQKQQQSKVHVLEDNHRTASTFTLDGTDHPDTVLTTSMSMDMTLEEMINDPNWDCRYIVEDDLPADATLQSLVPPRPPSPFLLQAYGNGNKDGQSNTAPLPLTKQRQLFVSVGPCQTQIHRDCFDNFYVCAYGERQWTLIPPNDELQREAGSVSAAVTPNSLHSSSRTDGSDFDVMTTTLQAGDLVFVPAHFWHYVRSSSSSSVAINWYFEPFEVIGTSNKRQKVI